MPGRTVNCADDTFSASPGKILPGRRLQTILWWFVCASGNTTEVLTHTPSDVMLPDGWRIALGFEIVKFVALEQVYTLKIAKCKGLKNRKIRQKGESILRLPQCENNGIYVYMRGNVFIKSKHYLNALLHSVIRFSRCYLYLFSFGLT
jgi:hypothetical protein